jgi:hypothetical protein
VTVVKANCHNSELRIATVHALVVIPLAVRSLQSRILAKDPVFGYDPFVGHVLAMSSGWVWRMSLVIQGLDELTG